MRRYFIGLLIIIALLILLIVLLIPSGPKTPSKSSLVSYAPTGVTARMTIDGPEVSNQKHQSIQIDVGRDSVTYEQINGYEGQVVKLQTYTNNQNAYSVFLHALFYAGFTNGNKDPKLSNESGICPLGDRYVFELVNGSSDIQRYWATNCGGTKTYNGNLNLTITLFQDQVPDYDALSSGLNI